MLDLMQNIMTQTEQSKHEVLRSLPYGLYVVALQRSSGEDPNALVVSWLTQCSFEPPLLLLALRRDSSSLEILKDGKAFSVNLIDELDHDLARRFVRPAHRVGHKLEPEDYAVEAGGTPVLGRALAFIECQMVQLFEPGDHVLVVSRVVNVGRRRDGELLMAADLGWHYGG